MADWKYTERDLFGVTISSRRVIYKMSPLLFPLTLAFLSSWVVLCLVERTYNQPLNAELLPEWWCGTLKFLVCLNQGLMHTDIAYISDTRPGKSIERDPLCIHVFIFIFPRPLCLRQGMFGKSVYDGWLACSLWLFSLFLGSEFYRKIAVTHNCIGGNLEYILKPGCEKPHPHFQCTCQLIEA